MKTWLTPEVESLDVKFTEKGGSYSQYVDAIRNDVNDPNNTWYSYSSTEKDPNATGGVEEQ